EIAGWEEKTGNTQRAELASLVMMDEFISELFKEEERWGVLNNLAQARLNPKTRRSEYHRNLFKWATEKGYYDVWSKDPPPLREANKIKWLFADKEFSQTDFFKDF